MKKSKIATVLEKKLSKFSDGLYGIFLLIESAANPSWNGSNIGEMPPPYRLEITLVTEQKFDPEEFRENLIKLLFEAENGNKPICELAKENGILLNKIGVDAKNIAELTLLDLKPLIRYTFVDHLSNSSMATEP